MTSLDLELISIAEARHGIIHRTEAHRAGVSDRVLRQRVASGWLRQPGKHVFVLCGTPDTHVGRLRALVADLADDAVACGPTAAALHGFDGFTLCSPFDVLLTRDRNMRRIGHRVHTTQDLDLIDRSHVQGCPTLSGARTVIDLARTSSKKVLATAVDSGLRDGLFSEDLLHRRILALRRSGRAGIPKLLEVIEGNEITSGAHSYLERTFLDLVARSGLPRPLTQQVLSTAGDRLVRVDFHFSPTPVVVEVLGYRYHRSAAQMSRDSERQNALLRDGYLPYSFTYGQVVEQSDRVVSELRSTLALRPTG